METAAVDVTGTFALSNATTRAASFASNDLVITESERSFALKIGLGLGSGSVSEMFSPLRLELELGLGLGPYALP